jgi:protein-S-isoprenylcysteine O-methyltransferase Ste14
MPDRKSLAPRLVRRGLPALLVPVVLLFIPAGTLKFWQGWAFMAVNLVCPLLLVILFYKRDPQLLERRLLKEEKIAEQKIVMKLAALFYCAFFVLAGCDFRFGWSRAWVGMAPLWLTLLALAVVLGGQLFTLWVMDVNRFASRIIQIEAGQKLATTGPYQFVRHPMYSASVVIWFAAAPALGSYVAWPVCVLFFAVIVFRLLNEEKLLRRELPGYGEYCLRTRWRLIPFVW